MKRLVSLFVFIFLTFSYAAPAFAIAHDSPEYEKLKEYKRQQREKKEREKANPQIAEKGFWQKEAERSGFAGTAAMFGQAITGVARVGEAKPSE